MKRLFTIAIVAFSLHSCGDAGVGFNVNKEQPVDAPFEIPGPPVGVPLVSYNPDAVVEETTFDLSDVSSDVDDLGELSLNNVAYQITDISGEADLETLKVEAYLGGNLVTLFELNNVTLAEMPSKVDMNLSASQLSQLREQLFDNKELDALITLDLASVPDEDGVDMVFRSFYDVTLKIRQ